MLSGKKTALSVHPGAHYDKAMDARKHPGRVYHTVLIDKRHEFEGGQYAANYSGHEIYYKRACGPYAVSKMYKCQDMAEVDRLIKMSDRELPKSAQGAFPKGEALKALKTKADADRAYNNARSKERKAEIGSAAYGR
jgi:hypothetical protein